MKRTALLISVVLLLGAAVLAAADLTVSAPTAGQTVGPSTVVAGASTERVFLIIYTEVFDAQTGEQFGRVPGIRHWTFDDNSFRFRIATPRVIGGDLKLKYVITVAAYSAPPATPGAPDRGSVSVTVYSP